MSGWSLAAALAGFAERLRAAGVAVGPVETADALRAVERVGPLDRRRFAYALRACLAKTPDDRERFDREFAVYFAVGEADYAKAVDADEAAAGAGDEPATAVGEGEPAPAAGAPSTTREDGPAEGASSSSGWGRADPALLGAADQAELRRLAIALGRRLALRAARRWRASGRTLDMRASMRAAIARGGELFELRRRRRRRQRPRLVLLADVSHSMDVYSRFVLSFVYGFAQAFRSVDSYVFSTRLSRITALMAAPRIEAMLAELPAHIADWGGGTRIATSLNEYLAAPESAALDHTTVVMIVSDGWDTDPPPALAAALAAIQARCRALIWLDPLMGHPRYFSSALGMQHDSPHVDLCAPAADLASLAELVERLSRQRLV